ncbi:MAG: hypothetical protein ACFCU8_02010 [Thermosynechococcaceae cyanobacterium]
MPSHGRLYGKSVWRSLQDDDSYPCPFCRQGQVQCLYLMEAFSCGLCDRVFSANLPHQSLTLETGAGSRALRWYWSGDGWQSERQRASSPMLVLQLLTVAFALLPPLLIGVPAYLFPPLPSQDTVSFPVIWAILTGVIHVAMMLWLWLEYYQLPVWVILRIRFRRG